MQHAYIYDHVRTPRGKGRSDGSLHSTTSIQLAITVLKALQSRTQIDTSLVEDIVMGIVMPVAEQGQVLPRVAAIAAGYSELTAGVQVNRFCGSGLEACNMSAAKIMSGQADFVIGGGCESMSRVPILSDGGAWSSDPTIAELTNFIPQGISADLIANKWGYSREQLDEFAARSHQLAAAAWEKGYFKNSVTGVYDMLGNPVLLQDETIRSGCKVSDLAALKPSFEAMGKMGFDAIALKRYPELINIEHRHHAGNSSGIVDGACAILFGTEEAGKKAGLKPRGRIVSWAEIGSEPTIMLTAPSFAAEKALKRAGMKPGDIDLYEVNEAFAVVPLRFAEALNIDLNKINVNGGSIAMGHPLGATGAMILGTALDELERTGKRTALITLCVGAGMGVATVIERV